MKRKALQLPPEVAQEFVANMEAFFRARDQLAGDEIAAATGWKLKQHLPEGTKLRLPDVKQLFREMRDHLGEGSRS